MAYDKEHLDEICRNLESLLTVVGGRGTINGETIFAAIGAIKTYSGDWKDAIPLPHTEDQAHMMLVIGHYYLREKGSELLSTRDQVLTEARRVLKEADATLDQRSHYSSYSTSVDSERLENLEACAALVRKGAEHQRAAEESQAEQVKLARKQV